MMVTLVPSLWAGVFSQSSLSWWKTLLGKYIHIGVGIKIQREAKAKQKVGPGVSLLSCFQAGREDKNQQALVHTFAI